MKTIEMHDGTVLAVPDDERWVYVVNDPPEIRCKFRLAYGGFVSLCYLTGDNFIDACNAAEAYFMRLARNGATEGDWEEYLSKAIEWADWRDKG
jgi:hypothetical protein